MSLFVTLEGIEGCGKSTHCRVLAADLETRGHEVLVTREPGGTQTTLPIRALLADPNLHLDPTAELLLFLADRAQHVSAVIRPGLERGAVVICDRYSDSTMAYQGYGRGHELEWVERLNDWASLATVPDLTVWIDCAVETGLARAKKRDGGADRFEAESLAFHRRIRDGFAALAARFPERIVRIDGDRPVEQVSADVLAAVLERLARKDPSGPSPESGQPS